MKLLRKMHSGVLSWNPKFPLAPVTRNSQGRFNDRLSPLGRGMNSVRRRSNDPPCLVVQNQNWICRSTVSALFAVVLNPQLVHTWQQRDQILARRIPAFAYLAVGNGAATFRHSRSNTRKVPVKRVQAHEPDRHLM